jgi:hypothetical protein
MQHLDRPSHQVPVFTQGVNGRSNPQRGSKPEPMPGYTALVWAEQLDSATSSSPKKFPASSAVFAGGASRITIGVFIGLKKLLQRIMAQMDAASQPFVLSTHQMASLLRMRVQRATLGAASYVLRSLFLNTIGFYPDLAILLHHIPTSP